jgi:hypothetical protein
VQLRGKNGNINACESYDMELRFVKLNSNNCE